MTENSRAKRDTYIAVLCCEFWLCAVGSNVFTRRTARRGFLAYLLHTPKYATNLAALWKAENMHRLTQPDPFDGPPRRGATAPRPPACVGGAGPPSRQRRAALDFLAREFQSLEVDARLKQDLEEQVSSLEERLDRSEQLNAQYLRRIDMLEEMLRKERAGESAAAPAAGGLQAATSLAAAAAKLPLPPPPLDPSDVPLATMLTLGGQQPPRQQPAGSVPKATAMAVPPGLFSSAGAEEDEFDIDRLIQEQRDQPLPQQVQESATGKRAPIAVRMGGSSRGGSTGTGAAV